MATHPTIESVMTPYPYSIEADAHAGAARSMLEQFRIRHLPVHEGDRLVGVVSERDLKRAAEMGWDVTLGGSARVGDICTKDVYIVRPEEPLVDVLQHMATQHVDSVLIARHGKLAGIFTFTDACRHCAELLLAQAKA